MVQATVSNKAMVFDWLLQRHVHEYMDVDGRPIGESRAQLTPKLKPNSNLALMPVAATITPTR